MNVRLLAGGLTLALVLPTYALAQQTPEAPKNPDEPAVYEEQVVVSASKSEEQLVNAPAAVSLVTSEAIQNSPATNIGDLLRSVPGLNVTQVSARDVNLTSRGATSTLSTSQLALVDGRSVYLDFFGMVMWDLVPTNPDEIRQIEVIRGPASAVWGANAMSGVVNILTKSPRELAAQRGNQLTIGVGTFDRNVTGRDTGAGSMFYVNGSHAQAVDARWAYKLSAGYLTQDPLPRPTGTLPNVFRTPYPAFTNEGTSQPKFDARVDYDIESGGTVTVSGGVAGTQGLIHSGIGPFNISSDSRMTYMTTRYQKGGRRVAFFTNLLNGDASNLLAFGTDGRPLPLVFDTKTIDIDASDVKPVGGMHVLSYGGNYRHNTFDISLAPNGDNRNEGGGYVQDEMFLGQYFRWVIGGRVDKFSSIENAVFSPRTTFMVKPDAAQTFRVSFNRAFRAPSFINNNIDTTILNEVNLSALAPLPSLSPFIFPIGAVGNPNLNQEQMTAYEVGYTGVIRNRATVSAAVYWNNTKDGIYFTPIAAYGPANPPPRWPLPPAILGVLAALNPPVVLPSQFTYLNVGVIKDKGVELGVDAAVNQYVNVFTNYSYQAKPIAEKLRPGTSDRDINWPPRNRFNAGFNFSYSRFLGNLGVSYTSGCEPSTPLDECGQAYWQDVLDARFAGTTRAFTTVNGGVGVRWLEDRVTTSIKVNNFGNTEVMQHVFGDISKRQVVGEARFRF